MDSNLNVENVVKAPMNPVPNNNCQLVVIPLPIIYPSKNAPVILMRNVAIGNEVLFLSLNQLLIANRVMAPKNPPTAINKGLIMIFHLPQGVL